MKNAPFMCYPKLCVAAVADVLWWLLASGYKNNSERNLKRAFTSVMRALR